MAERFEKVAIAGVGLIGGSLALAARAAGVFGEVVGIGRSRANLEVARARGIVDRTADPGALEPVDLLVLAAPLSATEALVRALAPRLSPATIVTDVGSVKAPLVRLVESLLPAGVRFVGAHPIAGSERSGAAAADADLFRGARCVVTPSATTDARAAARIEELWRAVGAAVIRLDPEEHDRTLAWTSHLVHAIAYTLAGTLVARVPRAPELAGPSLRDATRVAASPVEMWSDILLANAEAVGSAMDDFGAAFAELRAALRAGDVRRLHEILSEGGAARERLEAARR